MTLAQMAVLIYGIFNLVGGTIGFLKAKSKASLIAGSVFGVILLLCVHPIGAGSTQSHYVALLVSFILGVRFFRTWKMKKRLMPDLIMVILSSLTAIVILLELFTYGEI